MTKTFNPQFADLLSESFSRVGIRPAVVTQEHIDEALRSAQLLLVEFSNRGVKQYQLVNQQFTTVTGQAAYTLDIGTLDVWSAICTQNNVDIPIWPMGRLDYQRIPNKENQGRPFNFFIDKGQTGNGQRIMYLWPAGENNTDVISFWAWTRTADQVAMLQTAPMAYEWFDAYAAGIAARMAEKYAPSLWEAKVMNAEKAFVFARQADRETAPTRFRMRGYCRPRSGGGVGA